MHILYGSLHIYNIHSSRQLGGIPNLAPNSILVVQVDLDNHKIVVFPSLIINSLLRQVRLGCFRAEVIILWVQTLYYRVTAVRLHVYLDFVKSIEQKLCYSYKL